MNLSNSGVGFYIFRPDRGPLGAEAAGRDQTSTQVMTSTIPGPLGIPYRVSLNAQGSTSAVPEWPTPPQAATWQPATVTSTGSALTMTLPAGLSQAAIGASWQTSDTDVTLLDPNGQTYTPQTNASIYAHPSGAAQAFYLIPNPPSGVWTVQLGTSTPSALGTVSPMLLSPATAPSLSLGSVTPANGVATIPYSASTFGGHGAVNLYYNATSSTSGGILIDHNQPLGQSQSYQWTLPAGLASGTYFIYGTVDDGLNDPVSVLAAQPLTWTNTNTPPAPQGLTAAAQNGILHAGWQPVANAAGYTLTLLDSSSKVLATNGVGNVTQYDLDPANPIWTGLVTGSTYQLEVAAVLASTLSSAASAPIPATLPTPSLPQLSSVTWSAAGTTGLGAIVVSGNVSNAASVSVGDNGSVRVAPAAPSGGSFSLLVPLYPGPNALTLTATSSTGDTATITTSVTYAALPPTLSLSGAPWNGTTVTSPSLTVTGMTDPGDTLQVNAALATVSSNGGFTQALTLVPDANLVTIVAANAVGLTSTYRGSITYTPPPTVSAIASALAANWPAAPADGSFATTLTVTLKDAAGNAVSGRSISLTQGSGHSTITTVSGTTNSQGQASFSVTDTTAETVTYTAKDTSDGLALSQVAQVTFEPRGDVNLDGSVTSVDALCVLRDVASLPSTGACPQTAATQAAAHVNGDAAAISAVDALCVLRIVATLPNTAACPSAGQTPSRVAGAEPAASAPGSVSLSLNPADAKLEKGKPATIVLKATMTGADLGAWTVDVRYDPSQIKVVGCEAAGSSLCNPGFAAGVVRVSGASASGLSGAQTLATLVVEGTGKSKTAAALRVSAETLASASGEHLAVGGSLPTPALPAASPTSAPTQRAKTTPAPSAASIPLSSEAAGGSTQAAR